MAESTWPSWPSMPVSWESTGTRRAGNQRGTSRSTEMKVKASPMPTSTRPATASGSRSVSASSPCPAAMSTAPAAIITREPTRSSSSPALLGCLRAHRRTLPLEHQGG